jgi:pimeloyl-ACP methyl ester carboxylesterase
MRRTSDHLAAALQSGTLSRRGLIQGLAASLAYIGAGSRPRAQATAAKPLNPEPYRPEVLPSGIRSRFVDNVNGIRMHVLEAGFEQKERRPVLLVHGFPELAYSWRKVMPALAAAGYHAIAPDLRGYGRTSGTDVRFDDDLAPFRTVNEVRDMLGLVAAFGYRSVDAIVGHDFGSPVSAWCAVVRPDVFRSVVMMSAPFGGTPVLPFNTADGPAATAGASGSADAIYEELARLNPPRKHYQRYYATREANDDMRNAPQGIHDFLRAYYHMKSADWKENKPFPLKARTAAEWARMPRYYIMDLDKDMAATVASEMPSRSQIAACRWLPEEDLRVYSDEYSRTGFQGGLQGYRQGGRFASELQLFSGRTIDQPSMFIAGKSDWGAYQNPGALERMQKTACTQMVGTHFVDGAGHWVQQEQPELVSRLLLEFLQRTGQRPARR